MLSHRAKNFRIALVDDTQVNWFKNQKITGLERNRIIEKLRKMVTNEMHITTVSYKYFNSESIPIS